MARIQVLVTDLMLSSKVTETLRSAGHEPIAGSDPDEAVDLIVADCEAVDLEAVGSATPPSLGFYSHVDAEMRTRAIEAGLDQVVPRSRMARELPDLIGRLLAG